MTLDTEDNSFTVVEEKQNLSEEVDVFLFPTSFAQQRLWFLNQLAPDNPFYNVSTALRLKGSLNLTALQQAFNEIVRRHETLRTNFVMVEGEPMQAIASCLTVSIAVINCHLSADQKEQAAIKLAIEEARRPFNLATDQLLRVKLLQLDDDEYVLLLNLHHIVADGWSIGVLIRELGTLYTVYKDLSIPPLKRGDQTLVEGGILPELPIQYADFAEWQRQWLQGEVLETQLAYWRQQLQGISVLDLLSVGVAHRRHRIPSNKDNSIRPPIPSYQGAKQFLELPHSLSKALKELSQQQGVTLFITLLAAFKILLYRYTQQEDIAVGSPIANRNRSEIEGLIGFFVNTLVLRTNFGGNPTFLELLQTVKQVALGAYAHQDLPFEKLVEELHPERDLSRNPLFQVSFSLQNTPIQTLELPEISLSLVEFDIGTAKLDLEFNLWEDVENIRGEVVYSTDLFNRATITRILGHFQTLLEGIVTNPKQHICELPILTEVERHRIVVEFNHNQSCLTPPSPPLSRGGFREINTQCFPQLFEQQVEKTPNAIALVFENQQLTYRELNNQANQIAHYLQKLGVVPEVIVGICLERSLEMIIGLLGILKAGGAYLPLDPNYPHERLKFMIEDANLSFLITHSSLTPLKKGGWGDRQQISIVCLDKKQNLFTKYSQNNPNNTIFPENLAYVIYTSGSTGKPKGVLIQHQGLCNLIEAQIEIFKLQPSNRILQFASLNFDASIFEIVMALRNGATLYLAKKEVLLPGKELIKLLRDRKITHATLPPAVLSVLPQAELPTLQTIICAGEACSQDIIKYWATGRRFFNAYGVTEATVWSTVAEIKNDSEKLTIGQSILNNETYILDTYLQPVPIGISGELYLGGEGIARGYLNRPDLTAEKFIPHPFSNKQGARIYKTGDLARYLQDGNIEYLGRIDHQVKIRGFRIELGEIETLLRQHPEVGEVVAIATEDTTNKRIVAYIIPNTQILQSSFTKLSKPLNSDQEKLWGYISKELRQFLKEKLPEYMIPSAFIMLDTLPLTPNGKLDRRKLPTPQNFNHSFNDKNFVLPRTATEVTLAKIWTEILNLERVSIHDNFFDLGGNSLLAIRLLNQIQAQFQRELPLPTLFLNPTIAEIAANLSSNTNYFKWSPLVAIQSHGSNPPFFCVHPIFGVVLPYYELAHHLGKNQPFYGLQPLGIDGKNTPLTTIEDMAAYYIKALQSVQPQSPYFIGGWSFGGLVAYEMAQQLQAAGHEVALVAIFDTQAPVSSNKPSLKDSFKFIFTTVIRSIWSFFADYLYILTTPNPKLSKGTPGDKSSRYFKDLPSSKSYSKLNQFLTLLKTKFSWHHALQQYALTNLIPDESRSLILRELTIRPMLRIFQANSQAVLSYKSKIYPKKIHLFTSIEEGGKTNRDPTMGWSELAMGGVEVHQGSGNHLSMLKKPHVKVLAEQLKVCFEEAKVTTSSQSFPQK
ncbi:MAG TPA: amino acid adenylation domain-containing protein [Oculatellaceae cyanobacterium]|jgi:amino acid adenylation domain-containing protein